MTAREVVECAKRINKRRYNEAKFIASVNGALLEKSDDEKNKAVEPLNEKEQKHAENAMKRMIAEKQREMAKRNQRMMKNGK